MRPLSVHSDQSPSVSASLSLTAEPWFQRLTEGGRIMRNELSDDEWTAIEPMLPHKPRGVP
ncbi:hypothetical protein H8B02_34535 [Bradyrhizobium sp. Pear77]|uniref:hypothetical protein n=1 Tax=Bradyrhizobium altum TaxID=1571202 RepID=UPI001E6515D6|nr:hypothetical protein [Bradyrhizobium altum]MCC8958355.1 hypothetical protein [Bradyrhizobium altum]